ncbi:MAG: hypothetical protein KJ884_01995 [Gammaproteobacteria bacterium]|uniref:Uncharacterized protein n=1 Tax=viral metagenome TaxID=1070528 RepID=A0A6M3J864_9ZZZZ|nr:hypothetical protein [Gammaproteobacteria bacterium]MBU1492252.1 hypothetical protein [Gammaproteobacteria bacterium]MBU2066823.1 hypothetical protein [Gammaproteobacteria bacterium]MBU2137361.1 hypothetical protein [Gammaproteobacteria bacterium]MBU2215078.1 hypothetical protein [Gammaproteobacteria bacterium]
MTITLTTVAIIAAVIIIALLGLAWLACMGAMRARTNGYDQGYSDAKRSYSTEISRLEEQSNRASARLHQAQRDRETILQDADRRLATYAGRTYLHTDLATLHRAAKQLIAAGTTFNNLNHLCVVNLTDQARFVVDVAGELQQVIKRVEPHFQGAKPVPATEAEAATLEAAAWADTGANGKSWLVYGPEGCGKTRDAGVIAQALGLTEIVDNWHPGQPVPRTKALVLTNVPGPHDAFNRRELSYTQAMSLVAAKGTAQGDAA